MGKIRGFFRFDELRIRMTTKTNKDKSNSRSPLGMTSKKNNSKSSNNSNGNPPFSMKPKRMGHPATADPRRG